MEEKVITGRDVEEGFTLIELLTILKHNILILISFMICILGVGILYTWYFVTPMYSASVDLIVSIEDSSTTGSDSTKANIINQVINNIKEYVKFYDIVEAAVEEEIKDEDLNKEVKSIIQRISASGIGSSAAVRITYSDKDPKRAISIIEAIADETIRRFEIPKGETDSLKYSSERLTKINQTIPGQNNNPTSPNKTLNLIISVLLGGIIGVVFVILKEQFSTRFKSKKDVESTIGLPVLAIIPSRESESYYE